MYAIELVPAAMDSCACTNPALSILPRFAEPLALPSASTFTSKVLVRSGLRSGAVSPGLGLVVRPPHALIVTVTVLLGLAPVTFQPSMKSPGALNNFSRTSVVMTGLKVSGGGGASIVRLAEPDVATSGVGSSRRCSPLTAGKYTL